MDTRAFQFVHHGGATGVTGSCHELRLADGSGVLVDCGLFQGAETGDGGADSPEIAFPVAHIKALVVTHVHLDHVGRIPYLLAAGFDGPIYCSEPSAILLPLVLEDALEVGATRDKALIRRIIARIREKIVALPYGTWQTLETGGAAASLRLKRAGHILGSAYVQIRLGKGREAQTVTFSGDLGGPWTPLLPAPEPCWGTDVLVLESTYGDRLHQGRQHRRLALKSAIERALTNGGTVLIPAFSIGRTQELLYELEEIIHQCSVAGEGKGAHACVQAANPWPKVEIILDSPLASRFTDAYRQLQPYWDREARRRAHAGRHPLDFGQLTTIGSHQEHRRTVEYLAKNRRPAVVIAASGMCTGGRIVNYLKAMLGDARHDVVFVGYQAAGTPGRIIQDYGPNGGWVELDGRRIDIRATVQTVSGYSAHADQRDLIRFVKRMRNKPHLVRLVHGDPQARAALAEEFKRHFGSEVRAVA